MFKTLKGKKNKKLWQLVGLVILVAGIFAGVLLVKQSQDIRERAGRGCAPGERCTRDDGCPGICEINNKCEDIADDCVPRKDEPSDAGDEGGDDGDGGSDGAPAPCNTETCPAPKYCQNGRCIGRTGGYGNHPKCDAENPCEEGKGCSTFINRCFSEKTCQRYSRILKCE